MGNVRPAVRRAALMFAVGLVAMAASSVPQVRAATPPTIVISDAAPGRAVPAGLVGFSVEPAELCSIVALAQTDPSFGQLFENLGPGTFRVGGNTGDKYATWSTTAPTSCAWNKLVMTPALVDSFVGFAQSVGYRVTWGVPLANGNPALDAAEAAYASSKPDVSSIEIGNEPNYYPSVATSPLPTIAAWTTTYQDYLADGGTTPVTGPAATTTAKSYTTPFLTETHGDLAGVTGHYYDGSASASPTCTKLLAVTTLATQITNGVSEAAAYGLPFVLNETNTFSGGGVPGASNAYCSALWAADFAMIALTHGAAGLDFHGLDDVASGNSKGRLQYYTPINSDGSVAPEYYGLLFAEQMTTGGGSVVETAPSQSMPSFDAYAVRTAGGQLRVALFNRGAASQTVALQTTGTYGSGTAVALTGPALTATAGVTLGGGGVQSDGTWSVQPAGTTAVPVVGNVATLSVPAYTALIVTLTPTTSATARGRS